jgi:hypothetical protein
MRLLLLAGFALAVSACGPTVGDACTTGSDCAGQVCINQSYAPGGYCSLLCTLDGTDCPTGTICVRNALGQGTSACFRLCNVPGDCRTGYTCRSTQDSPLICVGPTGF